MKPNTLITAVATALYLTACGGGGSDNSGSASVSGSGITTPPVVTAVTPAPPVTATSPQTPTPPVTPAALGVPVVSGLPVVPGAPTVPGVPVVPDAPVLPVVPVTSIPGSSTSPAAGPSVPLDTAISAFYTTAKTYNRTEVDPKTGNIYSVNITVSNITDTNIENVPVASAEVRKTILKNGAPYSDSDEITYFQLGPYKLIASQFSGSPVYTLASDQVALPLTAKPGDGARFYNSKTYDSTSKNLTLSTSALSWTIGPDTADTVVYCLNSKSSVAQVSGVFTTSQCMKINVKGDVVFIRVDIFS